METLKSEIERELKLLEEMIQLNLEKEKIEKQRKIVDKLLKQYTQDL